MAGPIKVLSYVTKKGVAHRATTRLKFKSRPNGYGITTSTISRTGRSLSITQRPTGIYARGIRPGDSVLGRNYKRLTPSSTRRFYALAMRVKNRVAL